MIQMYDIYTYIYIYVYDIYDIFNIIKYLVFIYIYANLPRNVIVSVPHPRRGDSQGQETFLATSIIRTRPVQSPSNHLSFVVT